MPEEPTRVSLLVRLADPADEAAWNEFLSAYKPWIARWLWRQGVREQDGEDVQSEVHLKVLREIRHFKPNGRTGAFRKWLGQVLRNSLKKVLRGYREVAPGGTNFQQLANELEDPQSVASRMFDREVCQQICQQLLASVAHQFDEQTLAMVRMVSLEGKGSDEVAAHFGVKPGTVRQNRCRVHQAIRRANPGFLD